jgi:magnesium-transporting ATPase (P-type)
MITGDSALTAASIAYQIGLIDNLDDTPEVIKHRFNLKTIEEAEKMSKVNIIFIFIFIFKQFSQKNLILKIDYYSGWIQTHPSDEKRRNAI